MALQKYAALSLAAGLIALAGLSGAAIAADPYANADPARRLWFKSLKVPETSSESPGLSCCDVADGQRVDFEKVKQVGQQWFVDLGQGWIPVPPDRVVKSPLSIDGEAYIFMMTITTKGSPDGIRCFLPPTPGF